MRASEVSVRIGDYFAKGALLAPFGTLLRTVNALLSRTGGVNFKALGPLPSYTVATLPDASAYARCLIYVSDGTSNKRLAVSDGTNWRFPDGNVVS